MKKIFNSTKKLLFRILSSIIILLTIPIFIIWLIFNIITFICISIIWIATGNWYHNIMVFVSEFFNEIWIDKILDYFFNEC